MNRVASLYLPQFAIERLRRLERPAKPPELRSLQPRILPPIDDDPGACSVPRGSGWRPGARWARDGTMRAKPSQAEIDALPTHQRPTMREMGRRSEPAEHPFKAMPPDEGAPGYAITRPVRPTDTPGRPMVLIDRIRQREVVTAACPLAMELGLTVGMAAAHARALVADLDVREADAASNRALLDRLALHAVGHWTPVASMAEPDGLWLDLTGVTHLFGGEDRFCRRLLRFFGRLGFTVTIAIAGTPGAAHALARYSGRAITILPPGSETQAIADLPLAALRLAPDALNTASRFGLERIADLYAMPRGPLAKRLGLATVSRLDQARGLAPEPIVPAVPFEQPVIERRLLEPISTAEAIAQVISDLVDALVAELHDRWLGVRTAVLSCLLVDGGEQHVGLGTARATRDAKHLKRMFAMRIERIAPGLGIEAMRLVAARVETLEPTSLGIALATGDHLPDIAPLVDQLGGRVGESGLFRMTAIESDVPERAVRRIDVLAASDGWPGWIRPVRLLRRPEPLSGVIALLPDHPPRRFVWRGSTYRVLAGDGPERIHGEWWRRANEMWAVRDYFRVEVEGGARFWLFRRGDGVDQAAGDLSWHLHGVFG